jgi:hypothetical protein
MSRADEDDEGDGLDDEEGELVERGTLRVDPKVAAEKLAHFQLSDPEDFLVPWLRAAVASRARRVSAGVVDGALTFQFDGDDPGPDALADLTAGFLSGDGGPVARNLAFGALALQRLSPDSVHAAREDGLTVLRVRWKKGGHARDALKNLRRAYGMTDAVLTVDGEPVPDPSRAKEAVRDWRGAKGSIRVLEDVRVAGGGQAHLYCLGAWVESVPMNLGGGFAAYVTDARFNLDLSQAGVLKDSRYKKMQRRLERMRRRLAQHEPSRAVRVRDFAVQAAAWVGVVGTALAGAYLVARLGFG